MTNVEWFYEHFGWRMAEPNDDLPPESGVSGGYADSNDGNAPEIARERQESCGHFTDAGKKAGDGTDSREKLLEDANELAIDYWDRRRTWGDANGLKKDVIALLDRQASITEREVKLRELYKFEKNHRDHVRSIEDVNQQLNGRIAELQEQVNGLTAERDNLASDLEACEREREEYRALCGKMLGVAQELRVVLEAWEGMQ